MSSYSSVLRPEEKKPDARSTLLHNLAVSKWGPHTSAHPTRLLLEPSSGAMLIDPLTGVASPLRQQLEAETSASSIFSPSYKSMKAAGAPAPAAEASASAVGLRHVSSRGDGPIGAGGGAAAAGSSFRRRAVKAWSRPDEEVDLPLDRDARAPHLKDHTISTPTQADLKYIINRWGERWAADREQMAKAPYQPAETGEHVEDHSASWQRQQDAEEMWDLEQFGAPTFGPGL
ncbi:hypothetical protein CEUSTIGMA_g10534.t1 [Chlamydomonas eustigma]|uniref:Uncharacterized protein n=1 Tax=Chlamydomonas eustigma TaxID=1157962 RepID=A0A250XJ56_9CHLO|nr:hypothetical protein CEUSTIGMA_g10534.t1 [Chlamydomonas eustigma]|eukprot:GAX83108.1 hypothetical protein CEUSTIGMA_g10534.t1 [Chlamydomonas eustigma]